MKSLPVLIGSSIPAGLEHLRLHRTLKQGDIVLTLIPESKDEALAVARYCREHSIRLCFSEFLHRGGPDLAFPWRRHIPREEFHSKADVNAIISAAGDCYFGRIAIGEIGGVLYWPRAYTINRRAHNWENLPPCTNHAEAEAAYVAYCKHWLDYERKHLGKGPLLNVDSSIVFKYHVKAGLDVLCLEVMPGDPHLMHAAIRGAARAFNKPWGAHIAMQCYGGMVLDELYQKRWRTSLFFSYIAGAQYIYPESGHYGYANPARNQRFDFHSPQMKRVRAAIRETWQFARIHTRPPEGPRVRVGLVHGRHDGAPGLWNRYAWGQYHDPKWLEGPAERGWQFVDKLHRKEDWPRETIQGAEDFSGNPPCGQYDLVPIEAPLTVLKKYSCLVFLGWNTITPGDYAKLKSYVKAGGRLVMSLPHLSTETDRAKDLSLFRKGDFRDLFGVRILGKGTKEVRGIKCMADSAIPAWRFPLWRINTDPRFMGCFTPPSGIQLSTGRVISGHSDFYQISQEHLTQQGVLIENKLGKGVAYLVAVWEYPADEGIARFTDDLLRVVLQGEQDAIRLLSSDRVRYAVYDGLLPAGRKPYSVVYLLNTDPDVPAPAQLWIRGRKTARFDIPPGELRLAYVAGDCVIVCEDKCVEIESWRIAATKHVVQMFSFRPQSVHVCNVGARRLAVTINGGRVVCDAGASKTVEIARRSDPARREFYAPDFMDEPDVHYTPGRLPY